MTKTTKPKYNLTLRGFSTEEFTKVQTKGKDVLVKLEDVTVQFGIGSRAVKAMKNINLNIYRGEVLGLVGESGSGKSTTSNAIMGLVKRKSGKITIENTEIPSNPKQIKGKLRQDFASNVQMIFQDPATSLNPQKTIKNILAEGLDNIDVKPLFSRSFDIETMNTLLKIVGENKKTPSLDKLTLARATFLIDDGRIDELDKKIYETIPSEFNKIDEEYASLAATYLDLRKNERKYFFTGKESAQKIKDHIISEMLESVGLTKQILNRFPLEFSGGQQQRIGISRAVTMQPKLLIADEPISALDVSIQAQVINIFNELKEKFKLTILFVAHDLRMVEYISDRIAIMYKGQIVEIGDAKEVCKNPIHPYSKSLLSAVPSINKMDANLKTVTYDHVSQTQSEKEYKWFKVETKEHYVYGAIDKVAGWLNE